MHLPGECLQGHSSFTNKSTKIASILSRAHRGQSQGHTKERRENVKKRTRLHAAATEAHKAHRPRESVASQISAFAPATVANLGPGFDWLGCAVEGEGDTVTIQRLEGRPGEVLIESIKGDGGRLSLVASENCAGIAALETIKLLGKIDCGISLTLHKGLPLGSGMGSSAASAAAAAWAVNCLFGAPLAKEDLILPGLVSEATVSGYHADNIAPALLGGFVLVRSCKPLDVQKLPFPGDLTFVLVNPKFEAPTKEMRAALPKEVPMRSAIQNGCQGGSLVAGILLGDAEQVGRAMDSDCIIEPTRGPLIPGFQAVKEAALRAGAYGCTISGAGPTCVAIVQNDTVGERVQDAMSNAFQKQGKLEVNSARLSYLDQKGARVVNQ